MERFGCAVLEADMLQEGQELDDGARPAMQKHHRDGQGVAGEEGEEVDCVQVVVVVFIGDIDRVLGY